MIGPLIVGFAGACAVAALLLSVALFRRPAQALPVSAAEVLLVRPGDILALNIPGRATREQVERLIETAKKMLPEGVVVAVFEEGIRPQVLRPGNLDAAGEDALLRAVDRARARSSWDGPGSREL